MNSSAKSHSTTDGLFRFRDLCLRFSELIKKEGTIVKPFVSQELPVFSALSPEVQERALATVTAEVGLFEEVLNAGHKLKDSPQLLWRSMNRLGLIPSADVFGKIGQEDLVEVYLLDELGQQQIFRNLQWFEYTSFTVEQMACLDWRFSTQRDKEFSDQIAEAVVGILTGRHTETFDPQIKPHVAKELGSPGLLSVQVSIKYFSPIRRNGQAVGGISILRLESLGAGVPDWDRG